MGTLCSGQKKKSPTTFEIIDSSRSRENVINIIGDSKILNEKKNSNSINCRNQKSRSQSSAKIVTPIRKYTNIQQAQNGRRILKQNSLFQTLPSNRLSESVKEPRLTLSKNQNLKTEEQKKQEDFNQKIPFPTEKQSASFNSRIKSPSSDLQGNISLRGLSKLDEISPLNMINQKIDYMKINFTILNQQLESDQILELNNYLQNSKFFKGAHQEIINQIIPQFLLISIEPNKFLFKIKDHLLYYFILQFGTCFQIDSKQVTKSKRQLSIGEEIGYEQILSEDGSIYSIKSQDKCTFYALKNEIFQSLINKISNCKFNENLNLIKSIEFFKVFNDQQKNLLAENIITVNLKQGDSLLQKNEQVNGLIIIKKGIVSKKKEQYSEGTCLEVKTFLNFGQSKNNFKVISDDFQYLIIYRKQFKEVAGCNFLLNMYYDQIKEYFSESKQLKILQKQYNISPQQFQFSAHQANEIIINQFSECKQLLIVIQGALKYENSDLIIKEGNVVFIEFLNSLYRNSLIVDNLMMVKSGLIAKIEINQLIKSEKIIEQAQNFEQVSRENNEDKPKVTLIQQIIKMDQNENESSEEIDEYKIIQILNKNQYLFNYLVINGENKIYEVNAGIKKCIIEEKKQKSLKQYCNALKRINFKFIPKFEKSFQKEHSIFIFSSSQYGWQLNNLLEYSGILDQFSTLMYSATLILCAEYLHTQKIIHRSINLNYILQDTEGYIYLRNSQTMKFLENGRTQTLFEIDLFMAPELLEEKDYSFFVDLYSIGVCIFVFATGKYPFGDLDINDSYEQYKIIKMGKLEIPFFITDQNLRQIIIQLLNIKPEKRLGGSYYYLKQHEYFKDFKWKQLMKKKLNCQIKPKLPELNIHKLSGQTLEDQPQFNEFQMKQLEEDSLWNEIF